MLKLNIIFILISLIFFKNQVYAYTFIDKDYKFPKNNINVHFASNSCAAISLSKMKSFTKKAAEDYWNKVATSALFLNIKGAKNSSMEGITDLNTILNFASKNSIIVGCSESISSFEGANRDSVLGVGTISCASRSNCRGFLILNGHADGALADSSSSQIIATIAHELGHSVGIGHSPSKHNLMYYSIGGKKQEWLGQDDIDAATHLYPHPKEYEGLLGNCGTIGLINNYQKYKNQITKLDYNDQTPSGALSLSFLFQLLISFSFMQIIFKFLRKLI